MDPDKAIAALEKGLARQKTTAAEVVIPAQHCLTYLKEVRLREVMAGGVLAKDPKTPTQTKGAEGPGATPQEDPKAWQSPILAEIKNGFAHLQDKLLEECQKHSGACLKMGFKHQEAIKELKQEIDTLSTREMETSLPVADVAAVSRLTAEVTALRVEIVRGWKSEREEQLETAVLELCEQVKQLKALKEIPHDLEEVKMEDSRAYSAIKEMFRQTRIDAGEIRERLHNWRAPHMTLESAALQECAVYLRTEIAALRKQTDKLHEAVLGIVRGPLLPTAEERVEASTQTGALEVVPDTPPQQPINNGSQGLEEVREEQPRVSDCVVIPDTAGCERDAENANADPTVLVERATSPNGAARNVDAQREPPAVSDRDTIIASAGTATRKRRNTRRGRQRNRNRAQRPATPPVGRRGEGRLNTGQRRGPAQNSPAASRAKAPHQAPPMTSKVRPEAIIIKVGKSTYADVVGRIQGKINPENIGAEVRSVRTTRAGDVIITMADGEGKAEPLTRKIKEVAEDLEVRSLTQRAVVVVTGLEATATKQQIAEAVARVTGSAENVSVSAPRAAPRGGRRATVTLAPSRARTLLSAGALTIGWSKCHMREATTEAPKTCYRCMGTGHIAANCSGPDRSGHCMNCGEEGHHMAACKKKAFCAKCQMAGHREGSTCERKVVPKQPQKTTWVSGGIQQSGLAQKDLGVAKRGPVISNDREAIAAAKAGQFNANATLEAPGEIQMREGPLEPVISQMTRAAEEGSRYQIARLREDSLRENVRWYISYFHDKPDDLCVLGTNRLRLRCLIQSEGLPVNPRFLKELYASYLRAYDIPGDIDADLRACAYHLSTEHMLRLQMVRSAQAAYMRPLPQPQSKKPGF